MDQGGATTLKEKQRVCSRDDVGEDFVVRVFSTLKCARRAKVRRPKLDCARRFLRNARTMRHSFGNYSGKSIGNLGLDL
jgi:hypothetical protein